MSPADTIFALASGRPPAAIAIIRLSGPEAHDAASMLAGDIAEPRRAALRTLRWADEVLDHAIVLRFDRPASATGEDMVELHCHGGRAVVDGVLDALGRIDGLRNAEPGEFTRRAFENGRIDLTEAEGLADLLEAETQSQRRAALALAEGGLRRQVEDWQQHVLALSARGEAAIDYDDEDGLGADPALAADCAAFAEVLEDWISRPRSEPLRDGVRVVLAGPPNSGKSSLLNVIAGSEKAIVTELPGTTRDRIEVPLSIDGVPLLMIDTAGLRIAADPVERAGVYRAQHAIEQADVLLWLGAVEEAPAHVCLIRVHSRCDLPGRLAGPEDAVSVSAVTGQGVRELMEIVIAAAKSLFPGEGEVALNRRQWAAIADAVEALRSAGRSDDLPITAEWLRSARAAFDRLTGRAGTEEVLDSLFSRFCLGK